MTVSPLGSRLGRFACQGLPTLSGKAQHLTQAVMAPALWLITLVTLALGHSPARATRLGSACLPYAPSSLLGVS